MKFIPGNYLFEVHDTNNEATQKTIFRRREYRDSQEEIDKEVSYLLGSSKIEGVTEWSWVRVYLEIETQNRWPQ